MLRPSSPQKSHPSHNMQRWIILALLVAILVMAGVLAFVIGPRLGYIPVVSEPTRQLEEVLTTVTPMPSATPTQAATATATAAPSTTPTPTSTHTLTPTATPPDGAAFAIGYSVEGRPLEVVRFGSGPLGRMLVADIHGGYEANTAYLADQFIDYLKKHPELIPADNTLYVLRTLNPDGLEYALNAYGRANKNGVDLNRNWDANWEADWPRNGCWNSLPITAGDHPFSEPETQALSTFLQDNKIDALISYHSASLGIFPGGRDKDEASKSLAAALAKPLPYYYPPLETGCKYTGQMIDWASANGIAAVDIELTNHTDTDFYVNLQALKVFFAWRRE